MWAPIALLLLSVGVYSENYTRFSNVECQVLDPSYVYFKECNLKVLGRGIVGLNVNAVLQQPLKIAKVGTKN